MIKPDNILDSALLSCKRTFIYVFFFSFIANILMLAMPLYSLQVLDRVISSGSMETLTMLTLVMLVSFVCYGFIQAVRSFVLIRVSDWIEKEVAPNFLSNIVTNSATFSNPAGGQALRDLASIKNFLTGPGLSAIFDAPWSLVYLVVIWAIHPLNGLVSLFGAIILFAMAIINEIATKKPLDEANEKSVANMRQVELASRNAEVIEALGMTDQIVHNWHQVNQQAVYLQAFASYRAGVVANITKFLRMALQILVVGLGAYLTLKHELSVGGIIACSILVGRVLAPFEGAIASWKGIITARKAYHRLKTNLTKTPPRRQAMSIPAPMGRLSVEGVLYMPPGKQKPVIKGVTFGLEVGEILGIVGPSAAGKSTLAKLIMGVWKPQNGVVRLDSADVYTWNRHDFGKYVGYLPQDVELFEGTVKENIARMNKEASPEDVVAAAKIAGVHEMILHLPSGYETQIGVGGSELSAGQRQRIGLARAFYGEPKLVVLDEPNANLDQDGELALQKALQQAKQHNITTIVIAHRPSVLSQVDKVLVMKDGTVAAFGPRDEVLSKVTQQAAVIPGPQARKPLESIPPSAASGTASA